MRFVAVLCLAAFVAVAAATHSSKVKVVSINRSFPMPKKLQTLKHLTGPLTHMRNIALNLNSAESRQYVANVDEYVDVLLESLDQYMIEAGLDPMALPDINEGFEYKPALITYHGQLNLTNGQLFDLSTLHRGGSANLKYELELLNLQIPFTFNDLVIDYDYHADIMDIGPTGKLEGTIKDIEIFVDIVLDFFNMEILLQDFQITNVGKIHIDFKGNGLIDWLLELLVDVAASVLHDTIIGVVEGVVFGMAEDIILDINTTLQDIFTVQEY